MRASIRSIGLRSLAGAILVLIVSLFIEIGVFGYEAGHCGGGPAIGEVVALPIAAIVGIVLAGTGSRLAIPGAVIFLLGFILAPQLTRVWRLTWSPLALLFLGAMLLLIPFAIARPATDLLECVFGP